WCEGPVGVVSRDRRSNRRSALWSFSLSFFFCFQHLQLLYLWVMKHCFTELFGYSPTAPFYYRLDFLLQGLAHWNIRRGQGPLAIRPMVLEILMPFFLRSFSFLVPFFY
ncbi:hypothetical protein MTR67_025832, partial [Solanum verrucosum]